MTEKSAFASLGVASNLLCYSTLNGVVHALDKETGEEKWRYKSNGGVFTRPVESGRVIYFGNSDSKLYAVDPETGKKLWTFTAGGAVICAPRVHQETVFVGRTDGCLVRTAPPA